MELLGHRIRAQRQQLGLTLDEVAGRTGVSKPYLSLIETNRLMNPPSDEKIVLLEQALGFADGELLTHAHLQRTPDDVRAVLSHLLSKSPAVKAAAAPPPPPLKGKKARGNRDGGKTKLPSPNTDAAGLYTLLQKIGESSPKEKLVANAVPLLSLAADSLTKEDRDVPTVARQSVERMTCPDITDTNAFAARVHGDQMLPHYADGDIVIFSPASTPKSGDDCFVRFKTGKTTFKRVFFENSSDGAMVRLQPRNEKLPPARMRRDKIAEMYRAVGRYHKVNGG